MSSEQKQDLEDLQCALTHATIVLKSSLTPDGLNNLLKSTDLRTHARESLHIMWCWNEHFCPDKEALTGMNELLRDERILTFLRCVNAMDGSITEFLREVLRTLVTRINYYAASTGSLQTGVPRAVAKLEAVTKSLAEYQGLIQQKDVTITVANNTITVPYVAPVKS